MVAARVDNIPLERSLIREEIKFLSSFGKSSSRWFPIPCTGGVGCMPENILILRCVLEEVASHLSQSEIGQRMSRSEEPLIIIPWNPHLVLFAWQRCCNSSMSQRCTTPKHGAGR